MIKFVWIFGLILILSLVQFYLLPNFNILGVKPNFILVGLILLSFKFDWAKTLGGGILASISTGFLSFKWNLTLLVFPITVLFIYLLEKKFILKKGFLSILTLASLATIGFNFLYTFLAGSSWIYFFSFFHLIEILLNSVLVLVFKNMFKKSYV